MKKVLKWIQFNYPNMARANYQVFDDSGEFLGGKDIDLSTETMKKLKILFVDIAKEVGAEVETEAPKEESN